MITWLERVLWAQATSLANPSRLLHRVRKILFAGILPGLLILDRCFSIVIAVPGGISWSHDVLQTRCQYRFLPGMPPTH
jgi:hypothetical protein